MACVSTRNRLEAGLSSIEAKVYISFKYHPSKSKVVIVQSSICGGEQYPLLSTGAATKAAVPLGMFVREPALVSDEFGTLLRQQTEYSLAGGCLLLQRPNEKEDL